MSNSLDRENALRLIAIGSSDKVRLWVIKFYYCDGLRPSEIAYIINTQTPSVKNMLKNINSRTTKDFLCREGIFKELVKLPTVFENPVVRHRREIVCRLCGKRVDYTHKVFHLVMNHKDYLEKILETLEMLVKEGSANGEEETDNEV